nr:tripartite motif-containing protein 5-like [Lytechinus pictus]
MKRKAEKAGLSLSESLRCPLCLDNLKSPTLLSCGHTFCKVCLNKYDCQLLDQKYMECPVCKKRTKLGSKRIDGLVPNFSMIGLCDESPSKASNPQESPSKGKIEYCSLHSQVYTDILCEDCKEFTCLACFFDKHQGHRFKKQEELDSELTKKRESLLGKSKEKQAEIKRSISDVELHMEDMQIHLEDIATKIKNSHHKMVQDLAEKYRSLLQKLCSIEDQSSIVCEEFIAQQANLLQTIREKSDFVSLEASSGPSNITYSNAAPVALQQGSTDHDHDGARDRTGDERGRDHPQEITGCDGSNRNMQEDDIPGTSGIQNPPTQGQTVSLAISNEIVLPVSISGLAAVPYVDAVMVSYGQKRDGVDFFMLMEGVNCSGKDICLALSVTLPSFPMAEWPHR